MKGEKVTQLRPKNGKPKPKTLGPVPNLEEHVRSDWWRQIFNYLYLKTDGDVVDDINITRREIDQFFEILKLTPDLSILDLSCGQGRHSLELARRGFKAEGLDRSHYLIQKAKAVAQKEGLNVKFKEGDARTLPYKADSFDVVMILGNSFGYFENVNEDLRVLKEIFRVLKPWGKLLIDATDGDYVRDNYHPRNWEWMDKKHFVCRERSLSADRQRLISREIISHIEKGVIVDQFYAERLYTEDTMIELMKNAGFSDVIFHGQINGESNRNQDLGMMERRILVTGAVKKEWTPIRVKPKEKMKNVSVIFGDPSKPDTLKPLGIFDDDDFYTIDQLKSALKQIKGYNFRYINAHDTLLSELLKLRGQTDYVINLCDEGYGNDPRKELHVPAVLEMLGIPTTGSGPQCLAFCYDKSLVRGIAQEMGLPVPAAFFIKGDDMTFELPFNFPAIVKPNFGDSSFGITQESVVYNREALLNVINRTRDVFGYEKPILIEEFLPGKDISLGIIGNPPSSYTVLPISEEDYSELPPELPRICGYEAKWRPDSPYGKIKSIPANLPDLVQKQVEEWCLMLFERLECRDYARFDWRLDANDNPKLLEVNPNPGWCWDGHLANMAKFAGMSYDEMLIAILAAAEQRMGL